MDTGTRAPYFSLNCLLSAYMVAFFAFEGAPDCMYPNFFNASYVPALNLIANGLNTSVLVLSVFSIFINS